MWEKGPTGGVGTILLLLTWEVEDSMAPEPWLPATSHRAPLARTTLPLARASDWTSAYLQGRGRDKGIDVPAS